MNIEHLRKSAGLSQECVARQLGVSRNTVKNWEDGVTEPTISMAAKMAALFGVAISDLINGGERK
jgi:DNA-binding XRE family transcriptional regulator